jgi:hypothetical protein
VLARGDSALVNIRKKGDIGNFVRFQSQGKASFRMIADFRAS